MEDQYASSCRVITEKDRPVRVDLADQSKFKLSLPHTSIKLDSRLLPSTVNIPHIVKCAVYAVLK